MMGRALSRLHDEFDVSVEQIEKLFATIPFENKRIVEDLASKNVSQIIISDANSLFISMILGFHKLESAFSAVFTNPAVVDKSGKICVSFFHENQTCDLCPVNLCKGRVLSEFLAKHKFEKIVYVGGAKKQHSNQLCVFGFDLFQADGSGDFHACQLPNVIPLARKNFPLAKLLGNDCKTWTDCNDLHRLIQAEFK